MPIDNEPLSIDDIYTAAEDDDPTRIADNAALRQKFNNRFAFDPEVSLWDENELKKKQKIEALRKAAQRNKETVNPFLETQTEENKKIVMDDLDNLGSIGAGIGALNFKGASREELEDKILSITPKISPKNAAVAKKYQEQKTRKPKVYAPDATQLLVNMTRELPSLNQKPKDEQRIEPVQEQSGNRYTRGVKRGAANVLQTVALLHDAGYLGFERGMEAIGGKNIGQPINSGLEPTQNKLFRAMEQLKQEKYGASDSLNNLMIGAEMAGQQADANEASGTLAAVKYFLQNGTLGDAGEILSEVVPSLVVGGGAGAGARATIGVAAERALARQAGMLARRAGGTVDPKKLARFAAPAGGAVQGAVMTGVTDFAGSAGAEYSAQYNEGKNMGEAMDYALRRSLAQAGVSAIGGALIPFGYGGKLAVAGEQAVVQGVAGYASAEAGAAAVGEDLSYSEGALNVLMGAITALPEVVAVGAGESISRRRIMQEVENGLMETALAKHTDRVDDQNIKAGYFAGVIGNLFQRVKESKTAGRSDEVMRDFVNQTRSNNDAIDSVYVDVESFNQTLTKHNIPIEDLMEMSPEIARQWEKVEDIDGTIRIPLDELLSISYRIDNDPMLKDLVNILRSEPLAPNAREAEVSLLMDEKVIKEDIQKIQQQYEEIRAGQEELLSVEKQIKADLDALSTGFDKSIGFNQQAATLVSAMYESLANKVKVPVADLYKAMPVRIVSNEAEAAAVLGGMAGDTVDQSFSTKTPSSPEFKKWFGDSKAIDDSGAPKVFYHGTNLTSENGVEFTEFNTYGSKYGLMGIGSYFTENKKIADSYTKKERGSSPKIYEVYLSIKNPLDMDEKTDGTNWKSAFEGIEDYHEGGDTNESWFRAAELMLRDEMIPGYEGAEIMQDRIRGMGYDGITHIGGGRYGDSDIKHKVFIAFDPEQIKATTNKGGFNPEDPNIYNQDARGQIQFRKDRKGAVIIMGKDANFSTFAHEMGHHFLELNMMFARRPDAPQQLKDDMDVVLNWAKQGSDWDSMTAAEKTEVHEKFAETFEAYMFTGKAPSNALRTVFARFRSFMAAVYKNMGRFLGINQRADLNPEITAVMDRMLATQEAIEQVQRQRSLEMMLTPEMATQMGIPFKEFDEMQQSHLEATEAAINELEQKTIKDLAWYRNLRNKHMKAFSGHAKRIRQNIRESVAKEVAQEPVYQAIAFLRQPVEKAPKVKRDPNVVDTARDNLLEAIAKMGGIDAAEIESTWGIDQPESYKVNVGRVKKVARKGGLSIETVAERLAEYGYIDKDENGKFDTRQLEDIFTDSLGGAEFHSLYADYDLVGFTDDYNMAYGQIEEFPDAAKLNLDWLKSKYGEDSEIYKAIPKSGKYGFTSVDGFDPEIIAERFGYQSADQMIREIVEAPAPKDVIDQRANELIEAQHAELFDEDSVNQAIDEAVHNDIRAQMLSREMAAIAKLTGRHNELNNAAKAIAQDMAQKTQLKDLRPAVFSATELRLAKAYDKALKAGDTTEAVRIKRNQLINFHLTKEAYRAADDVKKLQALGKTISGSDERLAKNRDFNIVTITRFVASQYGVIDLDVNVVEQLSSIREYDPIAFHEVSEISGVTLNDEDNLVFTRIVDQDEIPEMTYEEFQTVNDTIRQLWHKSKESQKIKVGDKKIAFTDAIETLVAAAEVKPSGKRSNKLLDGKIFRWEKALQTQRRAEQFFNWLDGGRADGPFHKYIFNPMQDSLAAYRLEQRKMFESVRDIFKEFDQTSKGRIDAPELGGNKNVFENKFEVIHAILHSGNQSNKKRLVLGFGWGDKLEDGSVDYSRFDSFVARMFDEGTITKQDMDAVQKVWDLFDNYKKQAQETHKAMNGLYFKELPTQQVITPFGTYKGGYVPVDYDKNASVDAQVIGMKNDASTQAQGFATSGVSTGANFTKSRVDNFDGLPLTLDLSSLPMHLDKELRYIHLEENLKQASKLLRNKSLMREVDRASPYSVTEITTSWLERVASQSVYESTSMPGLDRFTNTLKRNTGIAFMSFNFINAIETLTSLSQIMVAVPAKDLLVSSTQFFANSFTSKSMTADVRALSPFMDTRLKNSTDETRFQIEQFVMDAGPVRKAGDFLRHNAYIVQQVIQDPFEVVVWTAAFNDAQTKKGMAEGEAVAHADGIVRMYMNDMSPEGISKLEAGNPLVRAMLMFYGWFNMWANTWRMNRQLLNENPEMSKIAKMGAHAALYTFMVAIPAIGSKALKMTLNNELSDNEDSEDWQEDVEQIVLKSQFEMLVGTMPFARDAINLAYRNSTSTSGFVDRYTVSPITSMGDTMWKTGKTGFKTAENLWFEGENEIDASQSAKNLLSAATFATGVPFAAVQRPVVYGLDVLVDEDKEPKGPVDAARGLLTGK